ncbi:hypothetical protein Pfo_012613 [Paulownia fortunei]|nr:hypothetical protein Pfo_012613 [Paulownia fortunei]
MATAVMTSLPQRRGQGALGARCDFIGSPTNLIMVTSTSLMLFAGRFGLAPSANRKDSGLQTGDPAGFTLADTLACGVVGHIIGLGLYLALRTLVLSKFVLILYNSSVVNHLFNFPGN